MRLNLDHVKLNMYEEERKRKDKKMKEHLRLLQEEEKKQKKEGGAKMKNNEEDMEMDNVGDDIEEADAIKKQKDLAEEIRLQEAFKKKVKQQDEKMALLRLQKNDTRLEILTKEERKSVHCTLVPHKRRSKEEVAAEKAAAANVAVKEEEEKKKEKKVKQDQIGAEMMEEFLNEVQDVFFVLVLSFVTMQTHNILVISHDRRVEAASSTDVIPWWNVTDTNGG